MEILFNMDNKIGDTTMFYRSLVTLFLSLSFCNFAHSQVRLEYKLQDGQTSTQSMTSQIDQKLVIAGMDTTTNVESRATTKSTAGKRDGQGVLRVQEKIESMQVNMSAQGLQYSFDSANPDNTGTSPLEMLRPIHKALSKSATTIVYDKNNR